MGGILIGIFISQVPGGPIQEWDRVEAVAGIGLKGDRNYTKQLQLPKVERVPETELTLIEWESVDMLNKRSEFGHIKPGDLRRNLVTKNINLNALTGKRFRIGEVLAEGMEWCEPCRHLEKLTGKRIMKPLVHKAGLRARILQSGTIMKGDAITVLG